MPHTSQQNEDLSSVGSRSIKLTSTDDVAGAAGATECSMPIRRPWFCIFSPQFGLGKWPKLELEEVQLFYYGFKSDMLYGSDSDYNYEEAYTISATTGILSSLCGTRFTFLGGVLCPGVMRTMKFDTQTSDFDILDQTRGLPTHLLQYDEKKALTGNPGGGIDALKEGLEGGSLNKIAVEDRMQRNLWSTDSTVSLLSSLTLRESLWLPSNFLKENIHVAGTGDWLLKTSTFQNWMGSTSESLLWLHGSVGTGKSMLSSFVSSTLQAGYPFDNIVTFYRSDSHYKNYNLPREILLKVTRSLLSSRNRNEVARRQLKSLLVELRALGRQISMFDTDQYWRVIRHSIEDNETMWLILDGLDENDDVQNSADEAIRTILRFTQRFDPSHRVKCLLSSGTDYLRNSDVRPILQINLDQEPALKNDIALYVQYNVQNLSAFLNEDEFRFLTDELVDRANGVFLWAGLIIRQISQAIASDIPALTAIRQLLHRPGIGDLPGLYTYMCELIPLDQRHSAETAFSWIAHASRPLFLDELSDVLQLDPKKIREVLWKFSGGLLSISQDDVVGFVHTSARKFLKYLSNGKKKWIDTPAACNALIAQVCLQRISELEADIFRNILYMGGVTEPQDLAHLRKLPFLSVYAIQNWKVHYSLAEHCSFALPGQAHTVLRKIIENSFRVSRLTTITHPDLANSVSMVQNFTLDEILRLAALSGFEKLARLELQMGATSHIYSGAYTETALHLAARSGHVRIVSLLLQYGADIEQRSAEDETALSIATAYGHVEVVKCLLAHKSHSKSSKDWASADTQELTLTRIPSSPCPSCGEKRTDYAISRPSKNAENLTTIRITGDIASPTKNDSNVYINTINDIDDDDDFVIVPDQKTTTSVKWFPGVHMYKALERVARRGIRVICYLLVAAGNDPRLIDQLLLNNHSVTWVS
ncbi:hypothetical protein B0O99DRAFT_740957 [Bisporella sp. PMI_857]|nr:hypothetical protein B0O99DRAFT_740957 [Bisporella sp. PMI_857]